MKFLGFGAIIYVENMKNKIEVLWDRDDLKNTSLVGYIECTQCDLESVFGVPASEIDEEWPSDGKTQNEWWVRINGTVVIIYDYKEDRHYLDEETMMFHVAGESIQALFELMVVGFDAAQVLTREEFYNKRFGNFA